MLHIDALLALYPDDAGRHLLLTQALVHLRVDRTTLRHAINTGNITDALQQLHQTKGAVSFLGTDKDTLRRFDQLARILQQAGNINGTMDSRHIFIQIENDSDINREIYAAFKPVESVFLELEASLMALINKQEVKKKAEAL